MTLAHDWRDILKRAWSVRLIALAAVLSGLEVALPFIPALERVPMGVFAALSALVTAAALVARIVAQRGLSG